MVKKKVGKQQKGNESSSDQLKNIPESGNKKKLNNKKSNDKKSIEKDKMKIFKKSIKKSYLSLSEESDEEKSKSDKLKVVKPAPKQIKQKKEAPQSNQSDKDPLNKYLKHEENLGMKNELEYNSSDNKPKKDSVKSSMNSKSKKDIENSDLNAHRLSKKNEDLDNKLSPPTNQGDETIKPTESKSYLKKILKEGSSDRKK